MASRAEELAAAHAGYIRELLEAHGVAELTIEQCMFHYKTAFVHGYKHGVEDSETDNTVMAQANAVISKDCLDMGHPRNGSVFNDGPGSPSGFINSLGRKNRELASMTVEARRKLGIGEDRNW